MNLQIQTAQHMYIFYLHPNLIRFVSPYESVLKSLGKHSYAVDLFLMQQCREYLQVIRSYHMQFVDKDSGGWEIEQKQTIKQALRQYRTRKTDDNRFGKRPRCYHTIAAF